MEKKLDRCSRQLDRTEDRHYRITDTLDGGVIGVVSGEDTRLEGQKEMFSEILLAL